MDSFRNFSENKLPDRSNFFNSLKDECISEKYYSHAINVWNTLDDHHEIYFKTNVLLLADVL